MSGKKTPILALLVVVLFIIGYFPALRLLVQKWSASEEYTHAFFAAPIMLYMLWQKRSLLENHPPRLSAGFGLALLIFSSGLYLISLQLQIPTVSFLALVTTILSGFIYLAGFRALQKMAGPLFLLMLLIPIPDQLYSIVTLPLQLQASFVSEQVIRLFNVPVFREGNIIQLPQKSFEVIGACSGLRSLMTLMALSLIFGYFTLRDNTSKVILWASSIPVAFLVNIIRLVTLVLAFQFFRLDLASGTKHTLLGVGIFGIGVAMLYLTQRMLESWEKSEKRS
ncbi:MAG: exosortase/archaeosortase family protein [Deltaproteobacteria bacterium]|jgi:exosortase